MINPAIFFKNEALIRVRQAAWKTDILCLSTPAAQTFPCLPCSLSPALKGLTVHSSFQFKIWFACLTTQKSVRNTVMSQQKNGLKPPTYNTSY